MSLSLRSSQPRDGGMPEDAWAVVGEALRKPYGNLLINVWPLDQLDEARKIADKFESKRVDGKSWYVLPVSLAGIVEKDNFSVAEYVEVSNLSHAGQERVE